MPLLIDGMDNAANQAYSAWPDRIYVLAKDGAIAYKGGPGPRGFSATQMEQALKKLLAAQEKK